jgi:hypothetical protein
MRDLRTMFGVAVLGAGLISVSSLPVGLPARYVRAIQLTSVDGADSPLGDGTALIVGPSGIPIPPQGYIDAVDQLYLAPRGFTGTVQAVDTPEALYPITGVHSLPFDTSEAQGQQILDADILSLVDSGKADAANPVVVFGYSQSSVISAQLMSELTKQGVPSDDVHFVLVGDESVPNGGSVSSFDIPVGADPSAPALGITFSGGQPSDLYPTDVYTLEYDGFADFPRYPIDELSTLNAFFGIITQHLTYADVTPAQISDAIALPTSAADTLTNFYVIPDQYLPLLEPLLWLGLKPLYDLLEPDTRILVDLGYGSLTEGWNQGPADVATPVGFLPNNIDPTELFTALSNGAKQGITSFLSDLQNPGGNQTAAFDALQPLVSAGHTIGFTDATTPSQLFTNVPDLLALARDLLGNFANYPIADPSTLSTPAGIVNDLSATLSADYATLLPLADTANALLTSLPADIANALVSEIGAGDPAAGFAEVIGGVAGLVPFALFYGALAPVAESLGGTLVNLVDLIPGV